MSTLKTESVADIEGEWIDPEFESSLIQRLRNNWKVPVADLSNYALATFIRQRKGLTLVVPEAKRRIKANYLDDTELYDEELSNAVAGLFQT